MYNDVPPTLWWLQIKNSWEIFVSGVEWVFVSFQVLFCLYKLQGSCFGKISKTWNSIIFGILLENLFIYSAFSGLSEKWWFSVFAGVFLVSGLQQVPQQQQSKPHMSHPMSPQPVSRPAWWLVQGEVLEVIPAWWGNILKYDNNIS